MSYTYTEQCDWHGALIPFPPPPTIITALSLHQMWLQTFEPTSSSKPQLFKSEIFPSIYTYTWKHCPTKHLKFDICDALCRISRTQTLDTDDGTMLKLVLEIRPNVKTTLDWNRINIRLLWTMYWTFRVHKSGKFLDRKLLQIQGTPWHEVSILWRDVYVWDTQMLSLGHEEI
jgi:hypothetical protein